MFTNRILYDILNKKEGDNLPGINERIKELRLKLGMSQEEFGNRIGLSKSGISNIENGTRGVRERHIKLICSMFNVSEVWLKTGKDITTDISKFESFISYLESIGYKIKFAMPPLFMSSESNEEQIKLDTEKVEDEQVKWDNDPNVKKIILSKGKITASFSEAEFENFKNTIERLIEFEIFKAKQNE